MAKDPRFDPKILNNKKEERKDQKIVGKEISNTSILSNHLSDDAITTSKIADNAVTAAKIATGAVGNDEINTSATPTVNTIYTNNWFRSYNATGWYNETYGGGIYMTDSTWVRTYNSKNFYCSKTLGANVIYSDTYIQPSAGSGSNGIIFPSNPGGGSGDSASIKYYATGTSESTVLEIKVENDAGYGDLFNPIHDTIKLVTPSTFIDLNYFGYENIYIKGNSTAATIIPSAGGSYQADFPGGWGGGLATFDLCCASIRYSGLSQRSDLRYKENIKDIQTCLKDIAKLKPVTFNWKKETSFYNPDTQYGFIAQDVEKVFPELINEDNDGYKSINSNAFVPMLVKCVQEQQSIIEKQQKQLEDFEIRLKLLEDLLK